MAARFTITEKTTSPLIFQFLENGVPVNLSAYSNSNIVLLLSDIDENVVPVQASQITITDPINGKVQYAPLATDLMASGSPYLARWKATDPSGLVKYFPSALRDLWEVTQE